MRLRILNWYSVKQEASEDPIIPYENFSLVTFGATLTMATNQESTLNHPPPPPFALCTVTDPHNVLIWCVLYDFRIWVPICDITMHVRIRIHVCVCVRVCVYIHHGRVLAACARRAEWGWGLPAINIYQCINTSTLSASRRLEFVVSFSMQSAVS